MLTIENMLSTHLVLPAGADDGGALKLAPGATAQIDKVTGPVKDAERGNLVRIHYPPAPEEPAAASKCSGKKKE